MSKYKPLADHLAALDVSQTRLTYVEIESLIGAPLPPSAHNHAAWWSNADRGKNGWSNLWKRAGWVRGDFSLLEKWVVFQRPQHFEIGSDKAHEGYEVDRRILASARNARLAAKRRELDEFTCKACSFKLELHGKYVIDVHHLQPFRSTGETITTLDKLVSLCPTCHRIAHLRIPPYAPEEIQLIRGAPATDTQ
jgi:predicted HNH restriction endonuclease